MAKDYEQHTIGGVPLRHDCNDHTLGFGCSDDDGGLCFYWITGVAQLDELVELAVSVRAARAEYEADDV